jgi:hypothetical protein
MTQTQEKAADLSATDRAEQTLTRAGKQLGRLAGQATLRLRQASQAFREEADRLDTPTSTQQGSQTSATQHDQASRLTLQRAEVLVGQFGQRISHWALGGNLSMQRTVARLREDAEDMWMEAQEMHKEWREKRVYVEDEAD